MKKSVLHKKKGNATTVILHRQFTPETLKAVSPILTKAVSDGELGLLVCGDMESQINESIRNPLFQMDQRYVRFLAGKLKPIERKPRKSPELQIWKGISKPRLNRQSSSVSEDLQKHIKQMRALKIRTFRIMADLRRKGAVL